MFHTNDTGKYFVATVLDREKVLGKRILASTVYMTGQGWVDGFKTLFPESGTTARYFEIPEYVFWGFMKSRRSPDYVLDELHQNMRLIFEFRYSGGDSLDWTLSLMDDPHTTCEEYVKAAPDFADAK